MRLLPSISLLALTACAGSAPAPAAPTTPVAGAAADESAPASSAAPATSAPAPTAPASAALTPLTLSYLGVAGWSISDGARTVLVDPYFSRPDFAAKKPIVSSQPALDAARAAGRLPARADAIVIGHSHVDHVLDAPRVAKMMGAQLLGTMSTIHYARAAGVPDNQLVPVKGGEDYAFDGLSIRVIPGLHSALSDKHYLDSHKTIAPLPPGKLPATMDEFAEGGTLNYLIRLGNRQILVIGSANFIERELDGLRPDVAIVATGLRQEIYDYSCRLMRLLGSPPLVLTTHFDSWTEPADTPLSAEAVADLEAFKNEIQSCAPSTRVIVPKTFELMKH